MGTRQHFDNTFWLRETYLKFHGHADTIIVDDEDDDFEIDSEVECIDFTDNDLDEQLADTSDASTPVKRKPKKKKCQFFSSQAVDDSHGNDDEDEDEGDDSDLAELIDDSTQAPCTQSMYLSSIKDIVGPSRKFRLDPIPEMSPADIYSQIPAEDPDEEDEYEMDSFCNDEIVYTSGSESPSPIKRKRRQRENSDPPKKKRNRIVFIESP